MRPRPTILLAATTGLIDPIKSAEGDPDQVLRTVGFDRADLRFSLNYLKDPQHTLTEIAYLLGYSEVSAFNRAFKRWTASTPVGHRRSGP